MIDLIRNKIVFTAFVSLSAPHLPVFGCDIFKLQQHQAHKLHDNGFCLGRHNQHFEHTQESLEVVLLRYVYLILAS